MRASRLLSLLLLLQSRGRMTARELAAESGVSLRTVYRDVEALSTAGVPIFSEPGPAGGFELVAGFRTRLTGLTQGEATAIFLAGMPGAAADLGLGSLLAAAELKLLASLPPALQASAAQVRERFLLDAPGWFHEGDEPGYLAEIATAVWEQLPLCMTYRSGGESQRERVVHPLGLVLKAGVWYLVAQAEQGLRTYRVSRIATLTVESGAFERPARFDLPDYWRESSEQFMARLYHGRATVRLSPQGRELLCRLIDRWVAQAALQSASSPDLDGWIEVSLPIESEEIALSQLLQFGPHAHVLAPATLRRRLADAAAAMAAAYHAGETQQGRTGNPVRP